jgi:hypothetical protein
VKSACHSNVNQRFASISAFWSPGVLAIGNGQRECLVQAKGASIWHAHRDGLASLRVGEATALIHYRDRLEIVLGEDDFHVAPKGGAHSQAAPEERRVLSLTAASKHAGDAVFRSTKSIEAHTTHLR